MVFAALYVGFEQQTALVAPAIADHAGDYVIDSLARPFSLAVFGERQRVAENASEPHDHRQRERTKARLVAEMSFMPAQRGPAHRAVYGAVTAEDPYIVQTADQCYEAEVNRVHGDLLYATRNWTAGEQALRQALAVAKRQGPNYWSCAPPSASLGSGDQGKRAEARDLLAPIYGWFTEGFDTPVLQDAT
jgi:hypothetical protein